MLIFIEDIVDVIIERTHNSLHAVEYLVRSASKEVVDFRDSPTSPPEYYDTTFYIRW